MSDHFIQNMDLFLERYCSENLFSGNVHITHRDRIVYQKCIGWEDLACRIPLTEQSRFTFYSLSKPFCTLGLMKLVDRGLISLTSHPGHYVPEAKNAHEDVTLLHILQHRSGITDYSQRSEFALLCYGKTILCYKNRIPSSLSLSIGVHYV